MSLYTVSNMDDTYPTIEAARQAWETAGRPQERGSSVWITEYQIDEMDYAETVRTITLAA